MMLTTFQKKNQFYKEVKDITKGRIDSEKLFDKNSDDQKNYSKLLLIE